MFTRVSRNLWFLVAAAVAIAAVMAVVLATSGAGPGEKPQCSATVIDYTPDHMLGNTSGIQRAASELQAHGLTIRVRAIASLPKGDFIRWLAWATVRCPHWLGPYTMVRGSKVYHLPERMLVVLAAKGKGPFLYWGDQAHRLLGDKVIGQMMADDQHGKYAEALDAADHQMQTVAPHAPPVGGSPAHSPVVWVLIICVIAEVVILGRIAWLLWRKRRPRRADPQVDASEIIPAAFDLVRNSHPSNYLLALMPPDEAAKLTTEWERLGQRCQGVSDEWRLATTADQKYAAYGKAKRLMTDIGSFRSRAESVFARLHGHQLTAGTDTSSEQP